MVEREYDALARLELLARATNDLRPTSEFTDAVMGEIDPASNVLVRAARLTEDLEPSADFTSTVMRGLEAQMTEPVWSDGVVRWARFALVSAAAAAAVSLFISNYTERVLDSDILDGIASVEVDE